MALRIGATTPTLRVGQSGVTRIYLGASLAYEALAATSEYVVASTSQPPWALTGTWAQGVGDIYTQAVGATATLTQTCTRVRLYGVRDVNAGVAQITLDAAVVATFDQYAAARQEDVLLFDSGLLTDASHTVVVTCTGDRNALASGQYINVARAVLTTTGAPPVVTEPPPSTPGTVTRPAIHLQPFRGSWAEGKAAGTWSIWNTPLGSGAQHVSANMKRPTENGGKIYQDRIHLGYPGDPIKTLSAAKKADGTTYEQRAPWKSGGTAQVRVTAGDSGPGAYQGGNHLAAFPLSTDDTRMWHGHPLGLVDGGNPTMRYIDPVDEPVDLYGIGDYGAHGGSHMSGIGGVIRQWEWDSPNVDAINHALEINIDSPNMYYNPDPDSTERKGKTYPANSTDRYAPTGYTGTNIYLMMGSLLRLPPGFDWLAGTMDLNARKILRAYALFGAYVVDDAKWSVFQFSAERTISLSAQPLATFHTPIVDAMMTSLIVVNNTATSVGGGGSPIGPLVPDVTRPGPFATTFYINPENPAKADADLYRAQHPDVAARFDVIANSPVAIWAGDWIPLGTEASWISARLAPVGQLPAFTLYNIPARDLGGYSGGGSTSAAAYRTWIGNILTGLGTRKAVLFYEPDALGHLNELSATLRAERVTLMKETVARLADAGHHVYVDSGHDNWHPAATWASMLVETGAGRARGIVLNVSNFRLTSGVETFGRNVIAGTGLSLKMVVDTSRNGLGPDPAGDVFNPPGRALGILPAAGTGDVDAYFWVKAPGESDGDDGQAVDGTTLAPRAGEWYRNYAYGLVHRMAGAPAGPPPPPPVLGAAKAATLSSDFTTLDLVKFPGSSGTTIVTGRARVATASTYPRVSTGTAATNARWDLTESQVHVEVPVIANAGGGTISTTLQVEAPAGVNGVNVAEILTQSGNLVLRELLDGVGFPADVTILYDAIAHRWWRLRHAAGVLYWETSPDKVTWTVRRQGAPQIALTGVAIALVSGFHGTEATPGFAEFDNLNI